MRIMVVFSLILLLSTYALALPGWDTSKTLIDVDDIIHGGPPKDGIPALTEPSFVPVGQAPWLKDDDRILGIELNGIARAYPLNILSYHELVNDQVGNRSILVSWCPLAFAAVVYDRRINDRILEFGVSGLLWNANLLMYDRQTESLWSQVRHQAVTGPRAGTRLNVISSTLTHWRTWKKKHPDTEVLSRKTGYIRDYHVDPYEDFYAGRWGLRIPGLSLVKGEEEKEMMVGILLGDKAKAYPLKLVKQLRVLQDQIEGRSLTLRYDPATDALQAEDERGQPLVTTIAYWYVWKGVHRNSQRYRPYH